MVLYWKTLVLLNESMVFWIAGGCEAHPCVHMKMAGVHTRGFRNIPIYGDVTKTPIRKTPSFRHKIIKRVFQVLYLFAFRLHGSAERGCEAHPRQTRGTPAMSNFWKM